MEQPYLIVLTFYLVSWALDNWLTASCLPYQGNIQSPNWSIHAIYQVWLCEEEVEIQNIQEWTMSAQKETVYPIKFSMTFNQIRCENLSTGDWLSQYYNISKTTFLSTFQDKSDNKISTNTITYKFNFFFFLFFYTKTISQTTHCMINMSVSYGLSWCHLHNVLQPKLSPEERKKMASQGQRSSNCAFTMSLQSLQWFRNTDK